MIYPSRDARHLRDRHACYGLDRNFHGSRAGEDQNDGLSFWIAHHHGSCRESMEDRTNVRCCHHAPREDRRNAERHDHHAWNARNQIRGRPGRDYRRVRSFAV